MKEIQERLDEFGLKVKLTAAARKWLAKTGYDATFGARPLRRALQKYVESPLSVKMLAGEIAHGHTITVDINDDESGVDFKVDGRKK
jgi:ATP-dependent Clp protease ATP-binding subunit ClpC